MTFIQKVSKTIERLGGVFVSKSADSDSVYYNLYGTKVRVSNHFRCIVNKCNVNIVGSSNGTYAIVCVNNIPIVYKNARELNLFLRMYSDCQRCNMGGAEYDLAKELREKEEKLKNMCDEIKESNSTVTKLRAEIKKKQDEIRNLCEGDTLIVDFANLNVKQQTRIRNEIKSYMNQNSFSKKSRQSTSSSMSNDAE